MKLLTFVQTQHYYLFGITILLCASMILSCKTDENIVELPTGQVSPIVPMNIGNRWVYRASDVDSLGAGFATRLDTTRIVRDTLFGQSERWFINNQGVIETNRSDGRWILSGSPYLSERYPVNKDDQYQFYGVTVRVLSTDESVNVPAGAYSCVSYHRSVSGAHIGTFWYAPKTGLVKFEFTNKRSTGQVYVSFRSELVSVSLN